ncbi:hypothetical protein HJG60_011364 [Phyllostomus discolor]|uniref:Uncharacterized protein n=1 Tax=Phyllostomus discolor TaxID=89673 RepID=A0A834E5E8_9CHIR|nr:hypothetical protein HJG60_011364 [Phyllostomus discolor]
MLMEKVLSSLRHHLERGIFLISHPFSHLRLFPLSPLLSFYSATNPRHIAQPFGTDSWERASPVWADLRNVRLRFTAQTSARGCGPPPSKAQFQGAFFRGVPAGPRPVCPAWYGHQLHSELSDFLFFPDSTQAFWITFCKLPAHKSLALSSADSWY